MITAAAASSDRASRTIDGWPGVTLVGVAFAVAMLGTTLPTPLYPTYAAEFGFGDLVTTVVFAVYAGGVITGLLLFGHWSDQLGRRPMLLAGLALSALSAVAYLMPAALGWLFVGRVLSGLSAGIFTGTATATIIDLAPPAARARAGLVAAAVNMGGLGLGPLLAGFLVQYAPSPTHLSFVVDLVLVGVGLLLVLLVREPVATTGELQLAPRRLQVPPDMRGVFVRSSIAAFAGFAMLGLFSAVSAAFLGQVLHHHNAALVGVTVAVLFVASIAGQATSSALGPARALQGGCALLILGMALIAVSLAAHSYPILVVGTVLAGVGQGMSFRAALGGVTAAAPEHLRGAVTSTFFVVTYVGISLPVIGEGALASGVGLVPAGVTFSVAVAVLGAVALALLVRSGRRAPSTA